MSTQTVVMQEVKSELLRLVDKAKEFYLNNPENEMGTWVFLTREGGVKQVKVANENSDGNFVYPHAELRFGSPVWLVAILNKDTDFSAAGMLLLLPDLAEAFQNREYYFTSRT